MQTYSVNGKYEIEADSRLSLLEQIIKKEKISIKEVKEGTLGKFIVLSQRDLRWAEDYLGKSTTKIKTAGCVVTDLSMLSYWYGDFKTPDWIAKNLTFVSVKGHSQPDLLLWQSIDGKLPFKFVWRHYSLDEKKLKNILHSPDGSAILQVNNGKHWGVLIGYDMRRGFKIADPYYKDTCYVLERYPNITGFSEFTRA